MPSARYVYARARADGNAPRVGATCGRVRPVRRWLSLLIALPRVRQVRAHAVLLLLGAAAVFAAATAHASQSVPTATSNPRVLQTPRGERPTFAQPLRDPPVRVDARRLRASGARSVSEHDGPFMSALTQGSRRAFVGGATGGLLKGGGAVVSNVAKKVAPKATAAVGKIRSLTSERQSVDVCSTCEETFGQRAFPDPATNFATDKVRN
jgi:hypothetical protein